MFITCKIYEYTKQRYYIFIYLFIYESLIICVSNIKILTKQKNIKYIYTHFKNIQNILNNSTAFFGIL